ncbi:MFS transporter [Planococcus sp. 1R117A]|uniref:MFS transporter n=1 Tax=Planococcus sp. 1R117A TaxID=3447020 RepID=UPI003EDB7B09
MRFFILIIIFFTFFDLFAQLPIISPFAVSLGATPFLTGIAVGMYSLSNIIGNILSGVISDKKGPYVILVTGLTSTGIVLFSYGLATDPYSLLAIRFFHGLAAGLTVPAAFTYLANNTVQHKRGKSVAISGAFVGLAAIIGPAFGAVYASRTSTPDMMAITGMLLLSLGLAAFFLLKKQSTSQKAEPAKSEHNSNIAWNRGLLLAFSGAFFLMFSQGVLAYMLPLKVDGLNFKTEMSGLLLSTFGISAILVFLLPINRIFDRIHPLRTLIVGFLLMGSSLFLLSAVFNASWMYATMCIYGIGFAFLFPSINSLLIDSTHPHSRGKAYGYFYAFFSLGVVGGSSFTGALELSPNEGFVVSGGLLLTVAAAATVFRRNNRH